MPDLNLAGHRRPIAFRLKQRLASERSCAQTEFLKANDPALESERWYSSNFSLEMRRRRRYLKGRPLLTDAVRVTLDPKSKCVLIEKVFGKPIVCNDGVTIAKEISFKSPEENLGASMLREVAERTGDPVGDGTSTATATILAHAIFTEGLRNIAAGAAAIEIKRSFVSVA